jgi:hypothetical protein
MPQLAKCPQCEHDLLAPEDVVAGAWVRCPSCWSFFQMKDATTRELPTLEVIEPNTHPGKDQRPSAPTVDDFSSTATWSGDAKDHHEPLDLDEVEPAEPKLARELHATEQETEEMPNVLEPKLMRDEDTHPIESHLLDEPTTIPLKPVLQPPLDAHIEPLKLAGIDEPAETHATPLETPEEAAQRIDAWFRSAKTLEDVPPVPDMSPIDEAAFDEPSEIEENSPAADSATTNATIELGSTGIGELALSDDFELEHSAESTPEAVAPWDDSHHMDQLLAEIQDQPPQDEDELDVAEAVEEKDHDAIDEPNDPVAEWMPEESLAIKPTGSQQRSKSLVRTLVLPAVCGLLGLGFGYYVLLWLRGPQIDFLDAAKYLPKAMLPASFAPHQLAAAPILPAQGDNTTAQSPANDGNAAPDDTAKTADAAKPNETPAEKQASFTEPASANKTQSADGDRYGAAAPPTDKPAEPAAFSPQPAAPVNDNTPAPTTDAVRIAGAPSFTASDLAAALVSAKDAEPGLVNGNLSDGREVARTKGFSYSILADLAQKTTFVDPSAADADKLQQDADNVFRTTLSTQHARDEVAQIVPKWIASPNRRQGGVFVTGTVVGRDKQGSVVEGSVDMGSGQPLPVLLPPALAAKQPSGPVAVVGFIVDKPAEHITGYTGSAPQAVFATRLIPLQ